MRIVGDTAALEFLVDVLNFVALDDFAGFEFAIARVENLHVIDDATALYLAVGRFDEAELVDARVAGKRADQADVRTFRRFDRAYAAVVRWVNVAHFESGAFARKTAGSKSRKTPLVRDFGKRIRLIHELRELRTAEKFADRGHDRLGVDEIVRHGRGHFLVHGHFFLDGALHADQADAELVFEEFTNRADAAIAEVIDVVYGADIFAQLQQVTNRGDEIRGIERASFERRFEAELDVEFQAADAAEIVFARIEEHAIEKRSGCFERRRIAGTQLAVDFDQRFARRPDGILIESAARARRLSSSRSGKKTSTLGDARFGERCPDFGGQRLVGFEQNFAGLAIDEIRDGVRAFEIRASDRNLRDACAFTSSL